jgi:hypothetical protein
MSRMPITGFYQSNGRAQAGSWRPDARATDRQLTHTTKIPRQKLIDEIKKQGKPYGLYFEDIGAGLPDHLSLQAFRTLPVLVEGLSRWPGHELVRV